MEEKTISMAGAAWLASAIASYSTKDEFIKSELPGYAFRDKDEKTRKLMLGQVYDLAVPKKTGKEK